MRESRTYGSVRGAYDETHVPTATVKREEVQNETSPPKFYAPGRGRCRAASYVTVRPVVMVSVGKGRLEGMAARHLLLFAKDLFVAASPPLFDLGQNLGCLLLVL
jgi:hypothetical protein